MPTQRHAEQDDFEDRIRADLRDAGAAFTADPAVLADIGEARGRRLLRRRRAAVVTGTVAVACAAVGGTLLSPWGHDGGTQATAAASGSKSPARPAGSAGSGGSAGTSGSGGGGDVTAADMIRTLEGLLPAGRTSQAQGRGTDPDAPPVPYAQVVFDDGKGAAEVAVSLSRGEANPSADDQQVADIVKCPDKTFTPYDGCVTSRLSDGSRLRILQRYEYPDRREDTKLWTADLLTPQGFHVAVNEWNAPAEKGASVTRPQPPLSTTQLKELVTAAAWRGAAAAIPDPAKNAVRSGGTPRSSQAPAARISGSAIVKTLFSLLPEGLHVSRSQAEQNSDYAYLVVDDGKGASMVQINVQPRMSDVVGGWPSGGETLPDGTKVRSSEGSGDGKAPGQVMRTVDTVRPDGLRVVISAFNSGSQITAPTRATPALTSAQLEAIATSAKWQALE